MSGNYGELSAEQILTLLDDKGIDEIIGAFNPAPVASVINPADEVKMALAMLHNGGGRVITDWLFSLTIRAPYPKARGDRFEELAIAAAKHEARAAVGEIIGKALLDGQELLNQKKEVSQ